MTATADKFVFAGQEFEQGDTVYVINPYAGENFFGAILRTVDETSSLVHPGSGCHYVATHLGPRTRIELVWRPNAGGKQ